MDEKRLAVFIFTGIKNQRSVLLVNQQTAGFFAGRKNRSGLRTPVIQGNELTGQTAVYGFSTRFATVSDTAMESLQNHPVVSRSMVWSERPDIYSYPGTLILQADGLFLFLQSTVIDEGVRLP